MNGNRAFRVAATGARVVSGTVIAAACVAGVVVGIAAPWPVIETKPAAIEVAPLPGDATLVCAGDFRAIGRDPGEPQKMVSAAAPRRIVDGTGEEVRTERLTAAGLADAGEPALLVGEVEGRTAPLIGAAESVALASADLAGFAAAPCREPRAESWLVGGSVATGTEDLVTLANPGEVPATVTLTVYGTETSSSEVVIPARTQTALPLASIAAGGQYPVVEVTATGSPVRAMLQSSLMRTLDPSGIDLQDAVAGPQQHPVIAGVRVAARQQDTDMAVLRMLSPHADTQAAVTVRPVDGSAAPTTFDVPLTGGTAIEIALSGVAAGLYSVEIDAGEPILSAVRQQDGVGSGFDFAWVLPAPEIDAETTVAVPAGPAPRLNLVSADVEATVTIEPISGGGAAQTVSVPAGGAASVELDERTVYALRPSGPVHAAVGMTGGGALAAWPVWPPAGAQQSITVYP